MTNPVQPHDMTKAVELRGITRRFGPTQANDRIDFDLQEGEIHGLLGENGAGKTTLMNVLYGIHQPDDGIIHVGGQLCTIETPADAIRLGIGMVHQHFMLIPPLSVVENIVLGLPSRREPFLDLTGAAERIREISNQYGIQVDPWAKVWQLSVGVQQRIEITKALYRNARVLILDEPTAVLTPQEVQELFKVLQALTEQGRSVIFITHKLGEVMKLTHRVTVLRGGRRVDTLKTHSTNEKELARMMVGRELVLDASRRENPPGEPALEVNDLWVLDDRKAEALRGVSFSVRQGEILGIAGVEGNGQSELAQALTGLRRAVRGEVRVNGRNLTNAPAHEIIARGVSHIPEDRHRFGLVLDFTVAENLVLDTVGTPLFNRGPFLRWKAIREHARRLVADFDIRTPGVSMQARALSGGNQQKLTLAREISRDPQLFIACHPTRGLDVAAAEYIHRQLLSQRDRGKAVLLISSELEELLALSDQIAVFYRGEIMGLLPRKEARVEEVGLMMMGLKRVP